MVNPDKVVIIGSGPAGLACAAELIKRGVDATVLERGGQTGAAWAGRYDALRFNTCRWNSALPGARFPRDFGQFPTRDQYVGYLQDYADSRSVPVRLHTEVTRLEAVPEGGWELTTSGGQLWSRHVVVATGIFNQPWLPAWADSHVFTGRLLHAAEFHNATPFAGQRVLVVGAGSTGMEIAYELARNGASEVHLSVRTPPNILLRVVGGLPADLPVPLFLRLPTGIVDRILLAMERRVVGDLSGYGLAAPIEGPIAGLKRRGAGTAIVDRAVIDAIRDRSVRIVAAVERLEPDGAVLADGSRVTVDSVIASTGYRTGLTDLVGHLGVLDERGMPRDGHGSEVLPGLRFLGYVYRPGLTKYVGSLARHAAAQIAAQSRFRAGHESRRIAR
ncbi:MAG: flavin-containing monooxygenase [Mycobacterium sp.]